MTSQNPNHQGDQEGSGFPRLILLFILAFAICIGGVWALHEFQQFTERTHASSTR